MKEHPEVTKARKVARKAKIVALKNLGWHLALVALPVASAYCGKLSAEAGMFGPAILFIAASLAGCFLVARYGA
jgi:NADH:ubiquinone oxidoreductase subunit 4 (subunit M)